MSRNKFSGWWLAGGLAALAGCLQTQHEIELKPTRHEIEVKPMHITVDVNVRVQNELKKEFGQQDEAMKKISDEEAAAALEKYLREQGG